MIPRTKNARRSVTAISCSTQSVNYQLWKVDSLIATVPDPVESGLGSVFDDYVDSIERAVSATGYVLDHFYNPWPSPEQLAKEGKG